MFDQLLQTIPIWLLGWLILSAVMLALWWRQTYTMNAGWVDVAWALGLGGLGVAFTITGDGWEPRRWLVGLCIGVWSLRLGLHLWKRVGSEAEDGRYANLRRTWGRKADARFFWFFQIQALLALVLALQVLVLSGAELAGWRIVDALALTLWVISIAGEGLADRQLKEWRRGPSGRGRTCRKGLWKYSRHPNYFFEWLHWLMYPLIGIGLSGGAWLWLAPLLMLFLICKVTGIPPTEEQSLRSRGDDYREYQRTTNAFFPGPPRAPSKPLARTR
ncbi:MAG: steroid 5-alpha reductase family enzyme [Planctomycetota bacterium]